MSFSRPWASCGFFKSPRSVSFEKYILLTENAESLTMSLSSSQLFHLTYKESSFNMFKDRYFLYVVNVRYAESSSSNNHHILSKYVLDKGYSFRKKSFNWMIFRK